MSLKTDKTIRIVLYEGEGAVPLPAESRFNALTALLEKGYSVTHSATGGQVAPEDNADLLVLTQPRGRMEDYPAHDKVEFADITTMDAAQICERVEQTRARANAVTPGQ